MENNKSICNAFCGFDLPVILSLFIISPIALYACVLMRTALIYVQGRPAADVKTSSIRTQCVGANLVRLSQTSVVQGFGPPDRLALQWDRKGSGWRYMAMKNIRNEKKWIKVVDGIYIAYVKKEGYGVLHTPSVWPLGRLLTAAWRVRTLGFRPHTAYLLKNNKNVNGWTIIRWTD
jgi:hypothetical protein